MSKLTPKQKELFLILFSVFILVISVILVVYSLTFLIKNINLILKPNLTSNNQSHFKIEEAQKIFGSSTNSLNF
ncbi:MAG: hypothetical protein ACP5HL_02325 [Minisyncoccia bacterium]